MRVIVCIIVAAIGLAVQPALAQSSRDAAAFWTAVQSTCDATAAKPTSDLGRRIAEKAIAEFSGFGGHRIDAKGRLVRFGLTEAEHKREDGGNGEHVRLDRLGWWRVMPPSTPGTIRFRMRTFANVPRTMTSWLPRRAP